MRITKDKERDRDTVISLGVAALSIGLSYLVYKSGMTFILTIWVLINFVPAGCAYIILGAGRPDFDVATFVVTSFIQWYLLSRWYLAFKRIGKPETVK